ncbi:helix-hairpin-helix domain-containing protein [uncultured Lactobacillus sp.]|uniref:helix-hairpin-helix domain-containing protein n=1 Tax=uncultured Lactobacillus sp. TaxID=153152 RepID=UPI0026315640|nr:helix-hairpin-helix domain-containing protein [uncultured Lactobacillus sp.]
MILEKIKEIWEEKKIAVIAVVGVIGVCGFYFYNQNEKVDNSAILNTQVDQNNIKQSTNQSSQQSSQQSFKSNKVTVDISGAVKHGGVYTLKNGARLNDLLEVAGGLDKRAQVKAINRAQLLKDQDQIYVPYQGEKVDLPTANSQSTMTNNGSNSSASSEQVHLNSATVADLQKLNGIGQKKAEQIIQYRDQNGGFKQIEDLTKVNGIGDKTFEKLKDQLAL